VSSVQKRSLRIGCTATCISSCANSPPPYATNKWSSANLTHHSRFNEKISRDDFIQNVADMVSKTNPLTFVDLSDAQYTIVVEVLKNVMCVGIVKNFVKFKKFNLLEAGCGTQKEKAPSASSQSGNGNGKQKHHHRRPRNGSAKSKEALPEPDDKSGSTLPVPELSKDLPPIPSAPEMGDIPGDLDCSKDGLPRSENAGTKEVEAEDKKGEDGVAPEDKKLEDGVVAEDKKVQDGIDAENKKVEAEASE